MKKARKKTYGARLGENVKLLRTERKMRQKQLADSIGWDQARLCDLEKGRYEEGPEPKLLKLLAGGLGVSLDEMLPEVK